MTIKIKITYLTIYLALNVLGALLASKYWWTDSFTLSFLNKESLALILSVGLAWIGIIYLSILIVRTFIVKDKSARFIGPIDSATSEFQQEIGTDDAKKFKNYLSLIAFSILIITLILFISSIKYYGEFQIKNNGKLEIVTVKNIVKDIKGNIYVYFQYKNRSHFYLPNKNYKVGDKIEIKYSTENPIILDYNNN